MERFIRQVTQTGGQSTAIDDASQIENQPSVRDPWLGSKPTVVSAATESNKSFQLSPIVTTLYDVIYPSPSVFSESVPIEYSPTKSYSEGTSFVPHTTHFGSIPQIDEISQVVEKTLLDAAPFIDETSQSALAPSANFVRQTSSELTPHIIDVISQDALPQLIDQNYLIIEKTSSESTRNIDETSQATLSPFVDFERSNPCNVCVPKTSSESTPHIDETSQALSPSGCTDLPSCRLQIEEATSFSPQLENACTNAFLNPSTSSNPDIIDESSQTTYSFSPTNMNRVVLVPSTSPKSDIVVIDESSQATTATVPEIKTISSSTASKDAPPPVYESQEPVVRKKYKKGGMAIQLERALQKQKAEIAIWMHEIYLSKSNNYVPSVSNGVCLVLVVKNVWTKFGITFLECKEGLVDCLVVLSFSSFVYKIGNTIKIFPPFRKRQLSYCDRCIDCYYSVSKVLHVK